MAAVTDEYRTLVIEDIETYKGLNQPLKTNLLFRLIIHWMDINKLHPNPDDEFSMPEIGPNYGIIGDYEKQFRKNIFHAQTPLEERLTVEKMSTGGYMLLNGHHRWMAARRVDLKKVPVEIVNVTPEEEIIELIKNSDKEKCVSFDLDEVLLTDDNVKFPLNLIYKKTLKKNAAVLIKELREMGFDVWVYTGNYYSKQYIEFLFNVNHTKVDGVVSGMKNKKSSGKLKDAFREKYNISLHIDNESIICVDTKTKEYEVIDINANEDSWAAEAMTHLLKIDSIKN